MKFQADDGKVFDTYNKCLEHERELDNLRKIKKLENNISKQVYEIINMSKEYKRLTGKNTVDFYVNNDYVEFNLDDIVFNFSKAWRQILSTGEASL